MRLALVAALLLAPTAAALDALPTHVKLGDTEARFLLRQPRGGVVEVEGDGEALVAVSEPEGLPGAFARVPASFTVEARPPERSWHGLTGTFELVARRAEPTQDVRLRVRDAAGGGTEFEWPAAPERDVPAGAWVALAALVVVAMARAHRGGS